MTYLQNLHTHTTYADGVDTPEEMIRAAIAKGFSSIGFSEHSPTISVGAMPRERVPVYQNEIRELAKKYEHEIEVFCGLEFDTESNIPQDGYDYLIGSMHYLHDGGGRFPVDGSVEQVREAIAHVFGDGMRFACRYFEDLCALPSYGRFDIIGHFDLVSKNVERADLFDPSAPEYINAGLTAIDALAGKIPFFEVNTGAISRGYRTSPYPAPAFVRAFRERGFGAVITTDCHNAAHLDCGLDMAVELLASCGFTERYILTKGGFKAVPLN